MSPENVLYRGPIYQEVLDGVFTWNNSLRTEKKTPRPVDKELDRSIFRDARTRVVEIFPQIHQSVESIRENNEIVYGDLPIESFPQSPFARLVVDLQRLRRVLMIETLERAENFTDLPPAVAGGLNQAWREVTGYPEPTPPNLNPETIGNLARLPSWDLMMWARFVDGFSASRTLLKRTLAVKFHFRSTTIQGYNKRALQLCESMLVTLDALAGCTPWQLHWDRQGYFDKVNRSIYAYVSEKTGMDHLMDEGRMWSDGVADDPSVKPWVRALELGELPVAGKV